MKGQLLASLQSILKLDVDSSYSPFASRRSLLSNGECLRHLRCIIYFI